MYHVLSLNGTTYVQIDVSSIPELADQKDSPLTRVRAGSYRKLSDKPVDGVYATGGGEEMLRIVNEFFEYLPEDVYSVIILQILNMRVEVYNCARSGDAPIDIGKKLKPRVHELIVGNDLYFKALQFITQHVDIEFRADAGTRSHDHPDKTYLPEDLRKLYAMMLCCRVLLPIFAIIRDIVDMNIRDQLISEITKPAFEKTCPEVVDKLDRYIVANMGDLKTKFKDKFLPMVMAGFTVDTLPEIMYANVVSSTFIIQDLTKSLVYAILRQVTQTRCPSSMKYVEIRTPSTFVDDDKSSEMEVNSTVSHVPMHIRRVSANFTDRIVAEFLSVQGVSKTSYRKVLRQIKKSVMPNQLTRFLVEAVFYDDHLGRTGMMGVDIHGFSKLLAAIIAHVMKLGLHGLVPMLFSVPRSFTAKDTRTATAILHGYSRHVEYVDFIENIKKRTASKHLSDLVSTKISELVRWYTENEWVVAVPEGAMFAEIFKDRETGSVLEHDMNHMGEFFTYLRLLSEDPVS